MKKIIFMMIALVAISATAQERGARKHKKERMEQRDSFTPEEIAQLHTKKLTLALELTAKQQKSIEAIELERAKDRKAKKAKRQEQFEKPSKEEYLAKLHEHLDKQIALKAEMKQVLSEEQFVKWEKIQARKNMKHKRVRKQRGKRKK